MNLDQKIALIQQDVTTLQSTLGSFQVTNAETQSKAAEWLSQIKTRIRRIEELRKEFTQPLNEQVKKINNMFRMQTEPLESMEVQLKNSMKIYMDEEERKAKEEADKLHEEQEAREKEEQMKLEAAREEEERLRLEAEKAKGKEKKKLEAQIAETQEAQKEAEAAMLAPAPTVEAPKTSVRTESGLTTKKKIWKWKLTNADLCRKDHPELFILDEKAVNKLVQGGTRQLAGIDIFEDTIISVKS